MNDRSTASIESSIQRFLAAPAFAVVGASNDPTKYGHRILAAYRARGLRAYAIHPREAQILGEPAYPELAALPEPVRAVSVITPPAVTERVVEDAAASGVEILWLQPGAESPAAVQRATELGLDVIHGGPCILVAFATHGAD